MYKPTDWQAARIFGRQINVHKYFPSNDRAEIMILIFVGKTIFQPQPRPQ